MANQLVPPHQYTAGVPGEGPEWREIFQFYGLLTGEQDWSVNVAPGGIWSFASNVGVGGSLSVAGTGTFGHHLSVQADGAGITGPVGIDGTLNVNDDVDFDQALNVDGAGTFGDDVSIAGDGDIAGSLTVHGVINATGGLALQDLHLTGSLIVDESITGHNGFILDGGNFNVTGGNASVSAGTFSVVPNPGNDQALFLKHNAAAGRFSIGATNSATPDLIFKDAASVETFRVGDSNATWQGSVSGDFQVTGRGSIEGDAIIAGSGQTLGFFGSAGNVKGTVSGSRTVGGVALAVLLNILDAYGLVEDNSSA